MNGNQILKIDPDAKTWKDQSEELLNLKINKPLDEYIKTFPLQITLYDVKNDQAFAEGVIDYGNPKHRRWLGKVTFFALSNGYIVETAIPSK